MKKVVYGALAVFGSAGLALMMPVGSAEAQSGRGGGAGGRQGMEQCVQRVLTGLYNQRAPEAQVGPAIVSQCDGPLRATLAEAIRTGEAGSCTVESCLAIARERAAGEATAAYRAQLSR